MVSGTEIDENGKSDLVIVYHRQPYDEVVVDGKVTYRENASPNGIVPTLKSFFGAVNRGSWVAWKQVRDRQREPGFERRIEVTDSYGTYKVSRLPLTGEQVKQFYHVTSKEAFWPILHSFPNHFNYEPVDWENFKEVNRLFAEAACEEAADDALIWVHDYNLWLCPHFIRQIKPNARIAFFHHTPFPSADIFNILPWRREIVESLLACDLIGFHIPRYARNFVQVARGLCDVKIETTIRVEDSLSPVGGALSEPEMPEYIQANGRQILIDAFPVGTNPSLIEAQLAKPAAWERLRNLRAEIGEQKLIMSIGRTDYVKGTKEMLEAYDRLLSRRPDLHGKVKLMVTSVSANENMAVYRKAQHQVEQMIGRIHGKYATMGWGPIMAFTTPVPFDEVLCYYRLADICWTTPLRDGLNLVAKEFVAAHRGESGVLVLSEFTGAAVEMQEAVMTNPYSIDSLVEGIETALDMDEAEQKRRMSAMFQSVEKYDISHWAEHSLSQFRRIGARVAAPPEAEVGTAAE
ncbi:glucosylglycerol-phosphate synthase [Fodinicurvata sp. EGI_FJ10296]|uniref:glucosylglycerol-phosphate synthase n=1 Tax=Fodinicurvata sp. EGI_FJ10296 TaxID=3231908 RepID=UPI003451A89A